MSRSSEIAENVNAFLKEEPVQLSTADSTTEKSLTSVANWIGGDSDEITVTFVLPPGYQRLDFESSIQRWGVSAGGTVEWSDHNDKRNAAIRLHTWADAPNGKCTATVKNVRGIQSSKIQISSTSKKDKK